MNPLQRFSRLVVLPHSVFALPFALAGFILAAGRGATVALQRGWVTELLLVVLCVVSARTAAMAFNRLVDAELDRKNPRTEKREIPAGEVSRSQAMLIVAAASIVFLLAAHYLGPHCLMLAPFVLLILFGYSFTKRFSSAAHLVLGLALALAPGGAWWVLRPELALLPVLLMFSVLFWVAGFDIIYSCQDVASDRINGVFSVPARLGVESALVVARMFHFCCWIGFLLVGWEAGLNAWYLAGMLAFGALLVYEHRIVSPTDLSRVNQAFFTMNGVISVLYLLLVIISS